MISNVSGGNEQARVTTAEFIRPDADLAKRLAEGTSLRVSGFDLHGSGISRFGDIMGVSNIGVRSARLYDLWLEKSFEASPSASGLAALADNEFATLDTAGLFFNETFGWPEFIR